MIRAAALAFLLAAPAPALAQDTDTILTARRAAQALSRAAVAMGEAEAARYRVAALTQTVRAYEEGLTALRDGLRRAVIRERAIRLAFEAKRDDISRLTGVLASIEQNPAPLLLLHPAGPLGTARSGMLLAEITPALQAEAETLRAELDEIVVLRSLQEGAAATLADGLAGAQAARLALSQAIAERRPLPQRFTDDPEALAAILESADTLESFAAGLTAVPLLGADPAAPPFRATRGKLGLPVEATVLRGFEEADAAGVVRPGLVLATRPRALVTVPSAATVRYAGPLPDYGNVIVVEPAAGYLLILAGLGELYVKAGEVLGQGAPVGLMGGDPPEAAEFLDAARQGSGGDRRETLYIELRERGAPVDPGPWFALERG
jgi:septal ring factor EnvC (AmiA/AmiB activator)